MQFNGDGPSIGKLVLRLAVAVLMAFHGLSKLRHGVAWMAGPLHAHGLPAWLAYLVTRPVALTELR